MNANENVNVENPFLKPIAQKAKKEPTENEYCENGLYYCKECHHPTRIAVPGCPDLMPTICLCKQQEKANAEAAAKKSKNEERRKIAFDRERSKRFEFTFANDDKRNAKASETLKKYCDNFEENKKSGVGFIIHSNQNGGGKTYLACAVANELIDKGKKVLVTDFLALRDRLFKPEAYKSGASVFANKDDVIKHLLDYDLVVIDDLGVEQSTEFMLEVEYRVIDALTDALVPLILTTNYTLAEIKGSEDINKRRVLDRITGSCALLSVDQPNGKSRRVEKCADLTRKLAN